MNVRSKSGIKDNGPDIHFYHFRIPFKETDSGNDRDKYAKHLPIQVFCDLRVAPLTENTLRCINRKH